MADEGLARGLSRTARGVRVAYLVVAYAFVVAILIQVFFAGLMIFGTGTGATYRNLHRDFGYGLLALPLGMLILAPIGRLPRRAIVLTAGLLVVYLVQTTLPLIRDPFVVAAFHPVLALVMFGLAGTAVVRARALVLCSMGRAPAEVIARP